MHIELLGVSHTYNAGTPLSHMALHGIDLAISPGERIGILGPTGSGKSTLARILAGLLVPTAGKVRLDDVVLRTRSSRTRSQRRRIGLALQYPEEQIFEQTVFREVAFGPKRLRLPRAEVEQRVHWALNRVGLPPEAFAHRSPFTLSGGEMRRVALASILSLRPEVLILDEPTAGLDPSGRRELLDLVNELHSETQCTLVIVSHDLGQIVRVVDRAAILNAGQIVADGPVRAVLSDRQTLANAGLSAPAPVALLHHLEAAGWPVQTDRVLPEEAAAEIYRAWQARGGRP
ncbi:MAG: ATP-binding cassette domain-containing protein [Anaerolineae bacterium]